MNEVVKDLNSGFREHKMQIIWVTPTSRPYDYSLKSTLFCELSLLVGREDIWSDSDV